MLAYWQTFSKYPECDKINIDSYLPFCHVFHGGLVFCCCCCFCWFVCFFKISLLHYFASMPHFNCLDTSLEVRFMRGNWFLAYLQLNFLKTIIRICFKFWCIVSLCCPARPWINNPPAPGSRERRLIIDACHQA